MAVASTRWSLVLRAGGGSLGALDALCGAYWFPVYAYLRRRGHGPEEAADQTQEFFAGVLRRGDLARVTREGGRFRNWLFTAVKHHHFHVRDAARADKRRREEVDDAEERFRRLAAPGLDPEAVFARQWALAVLASARARVEARYRERDDLPDPRPLPHRHRPSSCGSRGRARHLDGSGEGTTAIGRGGSQAGTPNASPTTRFGRTSARPARVVSAPSP